MSATYPGRLGLQQRVLPSYRAVFLDSLALVCQGGLSVFAGEPLPDEGIDPIDSSSGCSARERKKPLSQ